MQKILFFLLILGGILFVGCDDVSDESFSNEQLNQNNLLVQDDYIFTEKGQSTIIFFMKNDVIPTHYTLFLSTPTNGTFDEKSGYLSSSENVKDYITYIPNDGFIGQDSIFYEVCNDDGYCHQGNIYIMVYEENNCDFKSIPNVIYTKTLPENTKDTHIIDLTEIVCPLDQFSNNDSINIKGQSFIINELSPNKFSIQYKSPEKIYENNVVDELEITFCSNVNDCVTSKIIYTTQPNKITPCDQWIANDDIYQLNSLTLSINISSELFANDVYCHELEPKLTIIKEPKYSEIKYVGENLIYTVQQKSGNDEFTYQVCNNAEQCTEAKVTILSK